MTREEFYKQRRIWRMINSSVSHPERLNGFSRETPESRAAWNIIWENLLSKEPEILEMCMPVRKRVSPGTWGIKSPGAIACNIEMLPNSWPHPTKNP